MERSVVENRSNLLQGLKLISVAQQYNAQHNDRGVFQTWRYLRKLPLGRSSVYRLMCRNCSPRLPFDAHYVYLPKVVTVPSDIGADCVFCNIVRYCYLNFAAEDPTIDECMILIEPSAYTLLVYRNSRDSLDSLTSRKVQLYCAEKSSYTNPFRSCEHICPNPRDLDLIRKVQSWIKDCTNNHANCLHGHGTLPSRDGSLLPSRMIKLDLGRNDIICLASPATPVKYAALSYCWGTTRQDVTNVANLSDRYKQFSIRNLPQTTQDAIYMTKALGLEYLWIDSVCIVQDDPKDWATEAAKMGDIYSAAWIVLAATSASDCSQGFLNPRKDKLILKKLQLGSGVPDIHARQVNNHGEFQEAKLIHLPLFQRGWCLQERELARRIVHFLPDEVYMVCQTRHYCECGLTPGGLRQRHNLSAFRLTTQIQDGSVSVTSRFADHWSPILIEYTKTTLTQATDTLPALAGLAQRMHQFEPGAYIAGLWERDIAYTLGWFIEHGDANPKAFREALPEPTFSWTASSYPVKYPRHYDEIDSVPLCYYISSKCTHTTINVYGHVSGASLRLQGQVMPGVILLQEELDHSPYTRMVSCRIYLDNGFSSPCVLNKSNNACSHGEWHNDWAHTISDWQSVICFSLHRRAIYSGGKRLTLLLLQAKPGSADEHVRIGLVEWLAKPWFDRNSSHTTVTIT